jgi:hypothetical protein
MANEDKKQRLLAWLQTAVELEIATIPPYMVTLLSMKRPANREAADLIRGVMIEEMLHLALVGNVFNAVGGMVRIGKDNIPSYPLRMKFEGKEFKDRQFSVNLARFSKENIEIFMKIEEPQQPRPPRMAMAKEITIPGLTIGQFYTNIVRLLEELNAEDPKALFSGDSARQLTDDYYWGAGGKIIPVSDLASAKAALEIVIVQGEGAPSDRAAFRPGHPLEMGHYYRYSEIYYERHYTDTDDPGQPPTGEPLPVDYTAVYPIKENPTSADYAAGSPLAELNEAFNGHYTEMLQQIEQALTGTPKTLYTAIMNGMHSIDSAAMKMMATPIEGDAQGCTGCPTFEWNENAGDLL